MKLLEIIWKVSYSVPDSMELIFQGVLRIHVVEGHNLENRDVIGKSDPYVTLSG